MENRQRWVNLSYAAAGVLLWYTVNALLLKLLAIFDMESKIQRADLWIWGLSVAAGVLLAVGLYWSDRVNQYMNEVVVELSRVTWPLRQESLRNTYLVIIGVIFAGLVLGFMDFLWTKVVQGLFQLIPSLMGWAL